MSENWIAGQTREVMDPTLVARWELATVGRHLTRVYGALRGAKPPEPKEPAPPPPPPCPDHCECCGTVGEMRMVLLPAQETIAAMHALGRRALRGSRWTPPKAEGGPDG